MHMQEFAEYPTQLSLLDSRVSVTVIYALTSLA